MEEFSASLVREKIVFVDDIGESDADNGDSGNGQSAGPTVIRSNRIYLRLGERAAAEKIVVRTQNMHTTLRLAAKILFSFYQSGPLLGREPPFDWQNQWQSVLSAYENSYNPDVWAAVYINGKSVFKTTSSPFVDVVEQCALLSIDNYDATMDVAERALKQVGKAMRINHSSNVATVFTDADDTMRCGIIHRADGRDTAFNFTAAGGKQQNRIVQSFGIAAAFLEALNLRFITSDYQHKLRMGQIAKVSPEARQLRAALTRLMGLNKAVASFEEIYDVKYRPEKPDLFKAV